MKKSLALYLSMIILTSLNAQAIPETTEALPTNDLSTIERDLGQGSDPNLANTQKRAEGNDINSTVDTNRDNFNRFTPNEENNDLDALPSIDALGQEANAVSQQAEAEGLNSGLANDREDFNSIPLEQETEDFINATPSSPVVRGLKVEQIDEKVVISWLPYVSDDQTRIGYSLYRSKEPIQLTNFNLAENIAYLSGGITLYRDIPLDIGDYYYAVFVTINDVEIPIFSAGNNSTTIPLAYDNSAASPKDIYGITTWNDIEQDNEILETGQTSALFSVTPLNRSRQTGGAQALNASNEKGPKPGSSNTARSEGSRQPVNVYVTAPDTDKIDQLADIFERYLKTLEEEKKNSTPSPEELEAARRAATNEAYLQHLYPSAVLEILSEEKLPAQNKYGFRLQQILARLLDDQDWQRAQNELLDLLRYENQYSEDLRARITFYRGQIFYIFAEYDDARLEFLAARRISLYERDAQRWIQKINLQKLD